ncbi:MAG: WXG100 family type VII secretion target [Demequina sp.]|uniref:WXG100 family type VII secretion target n=1 Tax=Demequina sp. TaxID=2050685 RepID=UPI003A8AF79E
MTTHPVGAPGGRSLRRSSAKLVEAQDGLNAALAQIEQELADLDERVTTLRAAWTGEASDAYDVAQSDWTTSLTHMRDLLEDYRRRLGRIDERYRSASQRISGSIWT